MVKKKNWETKITELKRQINYLDAENAFLSDKCDDLLKSVTVLAKTCQAIYRCYPFVLKECCSEPDLIKLFKIQDAFQEFFKKLNEDYPSRRKEKEEDEI